MLCSPSDLTDSLFVCIKWQHEQYSQSSRISVGGESRREKREQSLPGKTNPFISPHAVKVSRVPFLSLSSSASAALELLNCFSRAVATATCTENCCDVKKLRAAEQQLGFGIYKTKTLRWHTGRQF